MKSDVKKYDDYNLVKYAEIWLTYSIDSLGHIII